MKRRSRALFLAVVLAAVPLVGLPYSAVAAGGFTNFELGANYVGQTCPSSSATAEQACTNYAAEPQIRVDPAGTFYGTSENGLGGGTDAWKSVDSGAHYTFLGDPDAGAASGANTLGFAPGGGDTDLATAPVANASGHYNVYVASLSLANVDVSTSTDGGATWRLNPVGALVPVDDREWIAADLSSKVCVSYHDIATFNIDVNCSYDAGLTFTQLGDAIDANHLYNIDNNEIGNLAIDPKTHYIYQTFSGIDPNNAVGCYSFGVGGECNYHVVYMAVSKDGGRTFTDYVVHDGSPLESYGHQFVNVSLDQAGNVYSVYSDNHNTYYSFSTDHGQTWSGPYQINHTPANTAIMPWSVAGSPGHLAVVYYGTSYFDGVNPPDNYPMTAAWYPYYAENDNALTPGSAFQQVQASPINHYGGVCEGGISCTGNRDLYDDFGVAASPITNAVSIIYSDDQYDQYATNPPPPGCTAATNNTGSCDHTNIATGQSNLFVANSGNGQCGRNSTTDQTESNALAAINRDRAAAGLKALTLNSTSSDQARGHACDNATHNRNSDTGSDGSTHQDRMAASGLLFTLSGENDASAPTLDAASASSSLESSLLAQPASYANIMNPAYTTVGIGVVQLNGQTWITEDFSN